MVAAHVNSDLVPDCCCEVAEVAFAATGQMEPGGDASFPVPVEAVDGKSCTCAACGTDTLSHFYTKETGCQQG